MSKTHKRDLFANLFVDGEDIEVEVTYNYYAGCRGASDGYQQIEPDDPPEAEILSVINLDNKENVLEKLSIAQLADLDERIYTKEYEREREDYYGI